MQEQHVWSDRLDLGDEELDHDHHLQIALVNALTDAIEQRRPRVARQLVEQLVGYSAAHFRGEEFLMRTASYDHLAAHAEEHRALLTYIEEIRQLLEGSEYELALAMSLDLRSGLASHIATHDRRYVDHVADRVQVMRVS